MKIRVYYEDVDIGGVVYHSKYLNFCERARSELFFKSLKKPIWQGYHFVVKRLEANYIKPAFFGDELEVKTSLKHLKRVSVVLNQEIFREGEKIFEMDIELVSMKDKKVSKIPDYFLEVLKE